MKKYGTSILATVLVLGFSALAIAGEVKMTGAEIKLAITGNTAKFVGGPVRQFFASTGETPYWDGRQMSHGTWDIRGDRYCSEWGGGTPTAVWSCYDVFRNENDEIIWIGDRNDRYRAVMVDGNHMPEQ